MLRPPAGRLGEAGGDSQIRAPMPGKVVSVSVGVGQAVTKGQVLLTLEAMKMEHAMTAPFDGVVEALDTVVGAQVSEGALLAAIAASA